jgi:hypothetical protein
MQTVRFEFCYHGYYQGQLTGMAKGGGSSVIFYEIMLPNKKLIYLTRHQFEAILIINNKNNEYKQSSLGKG